jgi:hypothetical protein
MAAVARENGSPLSHFSGQFEQTVGDPVKTKVGTKPPEWRSAEGKNMLRTGT